MILGLLRRKADALERLERYLNGLRATRAKRYNERASTDKRPAQ
jgi:hypothetical protein